MIAHLLGTVSFSGDRFVVLDVSGVGYRVNTTLENIREAGKHPLPVSPSKEVEGVIFFTHLAVRENAMDLYGFLSRAELEFFELLIMVSGIGPKTALGIMNVAPVETLLSGISTGDASYLTKVSGIGAKNAQKIVLELKDKVGGVSEHTATGAMKEEAEVLEAIQSLGYSLRDAREALKQVPEKIEKSVQEKIKEILKILGKQ